jgi:hypothetical protein
MLSTKPSTALQSMRRLMLKGATLPAGEAIRRELAHLNAFIPAVTWRSIPHA